MVEKGKKTKIKLVHSSKELEDQIEEQKEKTRKSTLQKFQRKVQIKTL
jgi:hypothetical protein